MIRTVGRCIWAKPTVFMPGLAWTEFVAAEWSCCADPSPQLIDDARVCRTCGRWAERDATPTQRVDESYTPTR